MGKRRTSDAEHMIDAVARLPWWAGVALAAASFLILNHLAQPPVVPEVVQGIEELGEVMRGTMVRTLASMGKVVVPAILLLGAGMSLLLRRRRASLHDRAKSGGLGAVAAMSWKDFERLIHELFRRQGYAVVESRAGPDGGVDLRLKKDGQVTLVQCKHWKKDVGVKVVRETYGVVTAAKANAGIVVSSSGFTADAGQFAASVGMRLIDGKMLEQEVGFQASAISPAVSVTRVNAAQVTCPVCDGEMIERTARKGSAAGRSFLGCRRFPACRGTRQLA